MSPLMKLARQYQLNWQRVRAAYQGGESRCDVEGHLVRGSCAACGDAAALRALERELNDSAGALLGYACRLPARKRRKVAKQKACYETSASSGDCQRLVEEAQ